MAVQKGALDERLERKRKAAVPPRALQILLEEEYMTGQHPRVVAFHERGNFVAEPEHAARLKSDYIDPATGEGCKCDNAALRLAPRLVNEADGKESAPATERTAPPAGRLGQVHATPGSAQHSKRCREVLRLEIATEGIGKQRHCGPLRRPDDTPGLT